MVALPPSPPAVVEFVIYNALDAQAEPLLVRTFPLAPAAVRPVPPFATGTVANETAPLDTAK